jgi:hypothetical protein
MCKTLANLAYLGTDNRSGPSSPEELKIWEPLKWVLLVMRVLIDDPWETAHNSTSSASLHKNDIPTSCYERGLPSHTTENRLLHQLKIFMIRNIEGGDVADSIDLATWRIGLRFRNGFHISYFGHFGLDMDIPWTELADSSQFI